MMKLYYGTGSCSLSPHIALREAGLDFDLVKVDFATKQTADGQDYAALNPKGYVPALQLADGSLMGEGSVLVQYIADQAAGKNLAPKAGTMERYRLMEWLNFISTELHKGFSPLFYGAEGAYAEKVMDRLKSRLAMVEKTFAAHGKDWLMGDTYTVADGYLFTVLRWAPGKGIALEGYPHLLAFAERMRARPAVAAALAAEGIA